MNAQRIAELRKVLEPARKLATPEEFEELLDLAEKGLEFKTCPIAYKTPAKILMDAWREESMNPPPSEGPKTDSLQLRARKIFKEWWSGYSLSPNEAYTAEEKASHMEEAFLGGAMWASESIAHHEASKEKEVKKKLVLASTGVEPYPDERLNANVGVTVHCGCGSWPADVKVGIAGLRAEIDSWKSRALAAKATELALRTMIHQQDKLLGYIGVEMAGTHHQHIADKTLEMHRKAMECLQAGPEQHAKDKATGIPAKSGDQIVSLTSEDCEMANLGDKINDHFVKQGHEDWQLGNVASRKLLWKMQARAESAEAQLASLKSLLVTAERERDDLKAKLSATKEQLEETEAGLAEWVARANRLQKKISQSPWISTSERMPTREDVDHTNQVFWVLAGGACTGPWDASYRERCSHWKRTNLPSSDAQKEEKPWTPKFKVGDRVRMIDEQQQRSWPLFVLRTDKENVQIGASKDQEFGVWMQESELEPYVWTLPAPPEGHKWHRDDWTQEMLPDGYRPLLRGEPFEKADEVRFVSGQWHKDVLDVGFRADKGHLHTRTTRPLPTAPEPPGLSTAFDASFDDRPPHKGHPGAA